MTSGPLSVFWRLVPVGMVSTLSVQQQTFAFFLSFERHVYGWLWPWKMSAVRDPDVSLVWPDGLRQGRRLDQSPLCKSALCSPKVGSRKSKTRTFIIFFPGPAEVGDSEQASPPQKGILSWSAASPGGEADLLRSDVVDDLYSPLLDVSDDGHVAGLLVPGKRQADLSFLDGDEHPCRLQGHVGAVEVEGDRRNRYVLHAAQVVAGVQQVGGLRRRVLRHGAAEGVAEGAVRRRRQAGDDGAGIDDGAGLEDRRRHRDRMPADADPDQVEEVQRWFLHVAEHRRVRRRCRRWAADGELPSGAPWAGEAVGEDVGAEDLRCLRRQREGAAGEAEEAGDSHEEPLVALAAAEDEVGEDDARGQC